MPTPTPVVVERPTGVSALAAFFFVGALVSGAASVSLLAPGGSLDLMWRLNPRAHDAFGRIGVGASILLVAVSVSCAAAGYGFAAGRRWGYRLGIGLLVLNLAGDVINVASGVELRAAVGIPIVAVLLWYLSSGSVRRYFSAAVQRAP